MLPTGTVTFLFTDLESSTQLWETHPEAMPAALARHDALLRQAVEGYDGAVVKTTGDGLHAAFASPLAAADAAIAAQRSLLAEAWGEVGVLRVRMALHTGEAELRDGDYYGPALNRAARLMAAGHGGQILVSAATAALLQKSHGQLIDLGEHRLRDLATAEHVYQLAGRGLPSQFPPISSLAAYAHNLPAQVTSFVGREREMAEVKHLLSTTRLLTLTGPGGTGKTRLALQVAANLLDHYAGGAWLVELASLSDPALLTQVVAAALRVHDQPGRPLDEVLVDYLRDKRLLLLLDNCEHLVDACARLADHLLRDCPHLTILVSSREALSIAGEVAFQVPSLPIPPVPEAGSLQPADALLEYAATRLFIERARAARPDFRLTVGNAPAVVQICRRLDGIPLAVELAAARVKLLRPEEIAARLSDRFRLLTGGSRTALPRQQTLRALVDWSWDLLPEPERRLLRRLSVFAAGWTLEAAEKVAGDEGGESIDVLEGLSQLVNKSLVMGGEEGRYRLLETIRQYARDRLLEAGEGETLRDRHAAFYLAMAREAEPHLFGREMVSWLDRLDAEGDNLRAALEWTMDSHPVTALHMAAALQAYWLRRSHSTEARRRLEQVLDADRAGALPAAPGDQAPRARVLATLSQTLIAQGEFVAAVQVASEAEALARRSGDLQMLAHSLGMLALVYGYLGRFEEVRAAAEESLSISRPNGYTLEIMMALSALVGLAIYGNPETETAGAESHLEEIERLAQAQGNLWDMALATMSLGRLASLKRQFETARARYNRAAALFHEIGDEHFVTVARSELAHALRQAGHVDDALALYRQTLRAWQQLGHRAAVAHQLECLAMIVLGRGEHEWAARLLGTAEVLREVASSPRTPSEQDEYEGILDLLRGQLDEGALAAAWEEGRAMPSDRAVAYALESQGA
jgi:predicted ATPase/class 3 adenylate cyclase